MRRMAVTIALAIGALLALSGTASAATWNVWPGHSIQRAIRHAVLMPPKTPRGFCAKVSAPEVDGICVLGQVDQNFNPLAPTVGTTIAGFRVKGYHGDGIFIFNVADSRIVRNVSAHNTG